MEVDCEVNQTFPQLIQELLGSCEVSEKRFGQKRQPATAIVDKVPFSATCLSEASKRPLGFPIGKRFGKIGGLPQVQNS